MTRFCYTTNDLAYLTVPAVYEVAFADFMRYLKLLGNGGKISVDESGYINYRNNNINVPGLGSLMLVVSENDILRVLAGKNSVEASLAVKSQDVDTAVHIMGFTLDSVITDLRLKELELWLPEPIVQVESELEILRHYRQRIAEARSRT